MVDVSAAGLAVRPGAAVSTEFVDPHDDWFPEAREARDAVALLLSGQAGAEQTADMAGAWINDYAASAGTRRGYTRQLLRWVGYCVTRGEHPLTAKHALASSYASHLAQAPKQVRAKGKGARGRTEAGTKPLSVKTRALAIAAAASFHAFAVRETNGQAANPFVNVKRPKTSNLKSGRIALQMAETKTLLEYTEQPAARKNTDHRRSFALVSVLYFSGARIDEVLSLDVEEHLVTIKGHRALLIKRKGAEERDAVVLPPVAADALNAYLNGRASGPLFTTSGKDASGNPMRWVEQNVISHLRMLCRRAGLDDAGQRIVAHSFRHGFITDSLASGVPVQDVQAHVGHKDPRTTGHYNHQRQMLDDSPAYVLAAKLAKVRVG